MIAKRSAVQASMYTVATLGELGFLTVFKGNKKKKADLSDATPQSKTPTLSSATPKGRVSTVTALDDDGDEILKPWSEPAKGSFSYASSGEILRSYTQTTPKPSVTPVAAKGSQVGGYVSTPKSTTTSTVDLFDMQRGKRFFFCLCCPHY